MRWDVEFTNEFGAWWDSLDEGEEREMKRIRTRPYRELRANMSPASRAKAEKRANEMLSDMPLCEVRHAREMSQKHLAEILRINQASVSKLERRTDMYISTLRSFIEAMGGQLEIKAIFPDGAIRISQFEELDESPSRV